MKSTIVHYGTKPISADRNQNLHLDYEDEESLELAPHWANELSQLKFKRLKYLKVNETAGHK